ncbi:MAG: hypothetical protein ACC609_06840 [Methanobacterium formicicum]
MVPKTELHWYLFEDSVKNQEQFGYPNFQEDFKEHMNTYLSYYPFIKKLNIISNVIPFNQGKKDKKTILAHHLLSKYPHILRSISKEFNLVILAKTPLSISSAFKNRANYVSLHEIYKDLYQGILNGHEDQLERSLENLKDIILNINPQFILVSHDVHPEDRLMVMAAKELGVTTIEIQHGVYNSGDPIVSGTEVDFVFVWGEFFKNLYLKQNIKNDNQIRILGYPHTLTKLKKLNQIKPQSVVYIGQNLEVLQNDFFKVKVDTVNHIQDICGKLGLKFLYRPHPSDNVNKLKKKLPNIKFISKRESLTDTFRNNELFISFNSTALIEAALNSRLCIQLKNFNLQTDDFEKLGICKSTETLGDLEKIIKLILSGNYDNIKTVQRDYIMIPSEGPGKMFLNLIENID